MNYEKLRSEILKNIDNVDKNRTFKLNTETVTDVNKFINSHIKFIDSNRGNKVFLPYFDRLLLFYNNYII